ncbi:hypothetical protein IRZ83_02775 [Flavobacterium sp. JLP]|uniref:hypothetical protein n=1 Tax=unclassified Flavobacterium TaxID=196869 RepID=UPI00188C5FB2|nr:MULTISPECIES: hypothetical protein [unclassified Flavobacterium]MBF4491460.1 hypothetical protein [Flavobacterium sp. MR2016-29]MBF4505574.1 hypothetical protein [Flavobacterium sp. JLP]
MFGIIPLILLILPLLFQLIFGNKAIRDKFSITFSNVSFISIISQVVLSIASYKIAIYNFDQYFEQHPNQTKCGMGFLGLIGFAGFLTTLLILAIIIQYFINRYRKNSAENS